MGKTLLKMLKSNEASLHVLLLAGKWVEER